MLDSGLFEQVGEVVRGAAPREPGGLRLSVRKTGVKAWYGDGSYESGREHYEAQLVDAGIVTEARAYAVEIGFHAEHPKEPDNESALSLLRTRADDWRPVLGEEAVAGAFLGRGSWRRVSETWLDPDLDDPDLAFDIGVRLVDYIRALEPLRAAVR